MKSQKRSVLYLAVAMAATALLIAAMGRVSQGQSPGSGSESTTADVRGQLAETIGSLASLHLYQTYLNIGFIADARAEAMYDDVEAQKLLASVLSPLETVDKQLEKVGKLITGKADLATIAKLRGLASLLRLQGKQLEAFWASDKEADGAKYEATRKKAWEAVRSLLGLKDAAG